MRGLVVMAAAMLAACSGHGDSGDGPSQDEMRDALARNGAKVQSIERIACKAAPDKPGFICDFRAVTCSPYKAKCDKSLIRTARFVNVGGSWMFMGDVASPSRGFDTAPQPEPSPAAIEAEATPASAPAPAASPTPAPPPSPAAPPSPAPIPTATPKSQPVPAPTPKPTSMPKPKPVPVPMPKPDPTPRPKTTPKPVPAGVTSAWLNGRWAHDEDACSAKRAVKFAGGGTFYGRHGAGRWTLKGRTVTVNGSYPDEDKPFDQHLAIERTGDDAMIMEGRRYHRCPN